MVAGAMRRPHRSFIALGGALLLLALAWLLIRPEEPEAGRDEPSPEPTAGASPVRLSRASTAPAPQDEPPIEGIDEALPHATCWKDLDAFDRAATLASIKAALGGSPAHGDERLRTYLEERLAELIAADPARALEVIGWAEAGGPEAESYLAAVSRSAAVHEPNVAARLLELGQRPQATVQVRAAAIRALETQRRLGPEAIRRLKALAFDETLEDVAWAATRTLGRVMAQDFERTGSFAPYWDELLAIGRGAPSDAVRLLALEMPSYSDPLLGRDSIGALADILEREKEAGVREMAAFRLSLTEDPQRALDIYREAFARERDLCVRWAMFRFAVRAAGPAAFPTLEHMVGVDPRFAQDLADFRRAYASGTVDFSRVWLDKPERHDCVVEEGAPHGG